MGSPDGSERFLRRLIACDDTQKATKPTPERQEGSASPAHKLSADGPPDPLIAVYQQLLETLRTVGEPAQR